jgi:hypothetical protein
MLYELLEAGRSQIFWNDNSTDNPLLSVIRLHGGAAELPGGSINEKWLGVMGAHRIH